MSSTELPDNHTLALMLKNELSPLANTLRSTVSRLNSPEVCIVWQVGAIEAVVLDGGVEVSSFIFTEKQLPLLHQHWVSVHSIAEQTVLRWATEPLADNPVPTER